MSDVAAAVAAVQTTVPEPIVPDQATPESQAPKIDPNEAFARKERQLRKQQQQMVEERKQQVQEMEQLKAKIAEYESGYISRDKIKSDPWSAFNDAGADYNQLTEQLLQQPQDPVTKSLMAKIKQIEAKQLANEQAIATKDQQAYDNALKAIDTEARMLVDSDPEFESIKAESMHEAVTELIKQTFDSDNYLMDVRDAATQVEKHLVENALRMSQLKKVQAKLKPAEVTTIPPKPQPKPLAATSITPRTITNSIPRASVSTGSKSVSNERRERAIAAFYGNKS